MVAMLLAVSFAILGYFTLLYRLKSAENRIAELEREVGSLLPEEVEG